MECVKNKAHNTTSTNERYTAEYEDFNPSIMDFETGTFNPHHRERGQRRLIRLLRNQSRIGLTKREVDDYSEVWEMRPVFQRDEIEQDYLV